VGRVEILVRDIFTPEEIARTSGLLRTVRRTMNRLHVRTRSGVLQRELLFRTGDAFDPSLLEETARNLRALGFLTNVSVVPVDTLPDGTVDVEVRVQETWSLKTHLAYSRASEGSQRWSVMLSEGNFLGHGLEVGAGIGEDEDYRHSRFFLSKRRVLGTPLEVKAATINQGDGYSHTISVAAPFYSLDDTWGLQLNALTSRTEQRFYLSNAGPAGADPSRTESLYGQVPLRQKGMTAVASRRLSAQGRGRVWRLGVGLDVSYLDFDFDHPEGLGLSDGRDAFPPVLQQVQAGISRREGTLVYPFLVLETLGRSWTTTHHLMQYGPVEDVPLDPSYWLVVGPAGPATGSTLGDGNFVQVDVSGRDWSPLGPGFLLLEWWGKTGLGPTRNWPSTIGFLTGWLGHHNGRRFNRLTRVFAQAAWAENLAGTEAQVLGLNLGLRTLGYDGMAGDRLMRWNLEHGIVLPKEVLGFYRAGFAVFYDGGIAWWHGEERGPEDIRHEAGFGLRLGSTRSGRSDVIRLDFSWELTGDGSPVVTAVTGGYF